MLSIPVTAVRQHRKAVLRRTDDRRDHKCRPVRRDAGALTDAARGFSPETLAGRVPACPEWTVHNVISHLSGAAADFVAGNLDGAPRPPWTAVQVDARRSMPIGGVLDEWTTTGAALERLILSGDTSHSMICNPYVDVGTHEAEVHTDAYEFFRATFGRRSPAQIRSWQWTTPASAEAWSTALALLPQTEIDLLD